MTIAYNEFGTQRWRMLYNSSGNVNDGANSVSTHALNNVIYSSGSFGNDYGAFGITDVRYSYSPANRERIAVNYPNPFNPSTNILFSLQRAGHVKITVFDVLGRTVSNLLDKEMETGDHSVTFNAENLNSGVYFYRVETPEGTEIQKMVLMK
ncbi:MAG: T9SS type A sorting domain-containing protein [Ignavibacteria bacterium]|nr:T9SS type A sorting domain-containing protein [Ignavibacteria bacterium]